jgi:HK97 family phage prohead protease
VSKKLETRNIAACELRADAGNEFAVSGLAARYNRVTRIGSFTEKIAPGAFTRSLRAKADVKATLNHDLNHVIGRTKSGTLTLADSPEGLRFRVQLDRKNQAHRDLYSSVKRGDLDSCSFAFCVPPNGDEWQGSARTLRDVDLMDVSIVADPAYPGTSVNARKKNDDDEPDVDDSDDPEDRAECACECAECADGNCAECSAEDCDDEDCKDCPMQPDDDELNDVRARLAAIKI